MAERKEPRSNPDQRPGRDTSIEDDMHRVESRTASDLEDIRALLRETPPPQEDFDATLEELVEELADFLQSHGHPHPGRPVISKGMDWRYLPEERDAWETPEFLPRNGFSWDPGGWAYTMRVAPALSDAWFAASLYERVFHYRNGKAAKRARNAFRLGHLLATWESRAHLANVRRGKKTRASAGLGGRVASASRTGLRQTIVENMRLLIAEGHSVSRAAELVAAKGWGVSKEANKKIWYRHAR